MQGYAGVRDQFEDGVENRSNHKLLKMLTAEEEVVSKGRIRGPTG